MKKEIRPSKPSTYFFVVMLGLHGYMMAIAGNTVAALSAIMVLTLIASDEKSNELIAKQRRCIDQLEERVRLWVKTASDISVRQSD